MTIEQVRALLRKACDAAGSQKAWAAGNSVSLAYVNDVLQGRREPGQKLLDALGVERVVTYRRIKADE